MRKFLVHLGAALLAAAALTLSGCQNMICDAAGKSCDCLTGDCSLDCPSGGCQLVCGGENCSMSCPGGDCQMTCNANAKTCKMTGCTKDCQLTCLGAATCETECTGDVSVCQTVK